MRRIVIVVFLALLLTGCATASVDSDASALAKRFGYRLVGESARLHETLPSDIDTDSRWSLIQHVVSDGGLTLAPYAGKDVDLVGYRLARPPLFPKADFWTIRQGGDIVGAYISEDAGTAGLFGLEEGRRQFAAADTGLWIAAGLAVALLALGIIVGVRRTPRTSAST